jgi:Amt family ammonium transporter
MPLQYASGDIAWVLACTALVWLMIPGVGYFYAGMARSQRNALAMIMCSVMSLVVVTVQVRAGFEIGRHIKGGCIF